MYKKIISKWSLLVGLLLSFSGQLRADEGMWLLALLKQQNAEELKAMGLKIPIEKLTGENEGALTEAVVAFGSGCTGSLISGSGLVLTNYHCSYGAIQQYISPTNDIFKKGYWAAKEGEELPVGDLAITINKKILDVTAEVKANSQDVSDVNSINKAIKAVSQKYAQKYPGYKISIRPYKDNTLFVLFLQLQYRDVRLVGVPPKNVAKFGGETDNWMWPRQSADFAYFRVYADKNGKPAVYSKSNVPLVVKNYLHISTEGYKNGDFAMSMGYPGQSERNATSSQIWQKTQVLNPPMIAVRALSQSILEKEMDKSNEIKQLYAENYANSANYYKNAVGMNFWVNKLHILAKKEAHEKEWMNWVMKDESRKAKFATLMPKLKAEIEANAKFKRAQTYYSECFSTAAGIPRFLSGFGSGFYTYDLKKSPEVSKNLAVNTSMYYKKMDMGVEKQLTKAVLKLCKDSLPADLRPDVFELKKLDTDAQIDQYVDELFKNSLFTDYAKLDRWFKNPIASISDDPVAQLMKSIDKKQTEVFKEAELNARKIYRIVESYYNSISDFKSGKYYPDADKSIRLSYGTVSDLVLDNKTVPYQTTLSELIAKADTVNKDYFLNKDLQVLWQKKDYGKYAVNGEMPVCFVTNGDVTGGNSGSPMMNAKGQIIGLVFDCNWESMTREFNYEKDLNRVICVDVRYLLFVTEKFSGTNRIIGEIEQANQTGV
ncbi:S46 family peptidase [Pedobacter nyackensis]|uniref:Dipeptidyl-peptidase n=1 Tax=Pedobacter nyackensis TaxID=475255 RepID=A0A1W2CTZ7_9SPHI|nr:S46 family peptidase [Pedobacter nyackensis]SMC88118.1 Peptidase S46 [Pedobacter nyackensis]